MKGQISTHWFFFAILIVAFLPASFTLDPTLDHDTYWHAAVGRWIAGHGTVPDVEPFSRLGTEHGKRWVAYSWLFELAMYEILTRWGEPGILWFRTGLCAISVASLLGFVVWRSDRSLRSVLVLGLSALLMMPLMKERPWHLSIAFTVATLVVVCQLRESGQFRSAIALPLLFILWANLHIQFVLGWLILGVAVLFPGKVGRRQWFALLIGCGLAVVVNPYHFRLYGVIAEYALHSAPRQWVQELAPLEMLSPWALVIYALIAIAGWVAVKQRMDGFSATLLCLSILLAFSMRRDLWLVPLAASVFVRVPIAVPRLSFLKTASMIVLAFLIVRLLNSFGQYDDHSAGVKFPREAVAFLQHQDTPGSLFNPFDWGGYLIWHLPGHPVSIDGRTNLYGDERLRQNFLAWDGVDWEKCEELQAARYVIAPLHSPLTQILKRQPARWKLKWEDATAMVFERVAQISE